MRVGVLAIQGDVVEHLGILRKLGVACAEVRTRQDLEGVDGLIMPGGESTAIGLQLQESGLGDAISKRIRAGMPVLATCAGVILLAKDISGTKQYRLGVADVSVVRNDYGRQADSFEADLTLEGSAMPLRACFIRAPVITRLDTAWHVLARYAGKPVLIQKGKVILATFHPELTGETRVHEMLLGLMR